MGGVVGRSWSLLGFGVCGGGVGWLGLRVFGVVRNRWSLREGGDINDGPLGSRLSLEVEI